MRACALPSPKTVCVPRSHRGQALQCARRFTNLGQRAIRGNQRGGRFQYLFRCPAYFHSCAAETCRTRHPPMREYGNLLVLTTSIKSRSGTLVRQLGFFSATALVVSNMIGTGIFTTTGFMVGDLGDPRLVSARVACRRAFRHLRRAELFGTGRQFSQFRRRIRVSDARFRPRVGIHDRLDLVLRRLFSADRGCGAGFFRLRWLLQSRPEAVE